MKLLLRFLEPAPLGLALFFCRQLMIIAADKINPQVAARLVPAFGRWKRFEPKRAEMMREQLERIVGTPGLSKDVYEQASKSLA